MKHVNAMSRKSSSAATLVKSSRKSFNVLVVGETCTDVYIYGHCKRLCPEAPVPVFVKQHEQVSEGRGMAGNVALNLAALGVACSVVTHPERIVKTRLIEENRNHQIVRIDEDVKVTPFTALKSYPNFKEAVVVIADYNKGFLTEQDIKAIGDAALWTLVDTKKKLGPWVDHVTYVKINEVEYEASKDVAHKYENKLIVTLGERGCMFHGRRYPVEPTEVMDIAGAGDTFMAALVARLIANTYRTGSGQIQEALGFANRCARQVVSKRGVAVVSRIHA